MPLSFGLTKNITHGCKTACLNKLASWSAQQPSACLNDHPLHVSMFAPTQPLASVSFPPLCQWLSGVGLIDPEYSTLGKRIAGHQVMMWRLLSSFHCLSFLFGWNAVNIQNSCNSNEKLSGGSSRFDHPSLFALFARCVVRGQHWPSLPIACTQDCPPSQVIAKDLIT